MPTITVARTKGLEITRRGDPARVVSAEVEESGSLLLDTTDGRVRIGLDTQQWLVSLMTEQIEKHSDR